MRSRTVRLDQHLDLVGTLQPLVRGSIDPTHRIFEAEVQRATRMPSGPVTLRICSPVPREVNADAWGPGAEEALDSLPDLIGMSDDPSAFSPEDTTMKGFVRRHRTVRMTRCSGIVEKLVPSILEQKVTGHEARRAYRRIVLEHGEPAPGPLNLHIAPEPSWFAGATYWQLHRYGVERRRAETVIRACRVASSIERLNGVAAAKARDALTSILGIGVWTAAEVTRLTHGDPDAVSIGDFHLPNLVAWALAGEPRADDARMLQLLAPYAGHRARAVRYIEMSGLRPPRFGHRMPIRKIASI